MKQLTLSSAGFDQFSKKTRKERFLEQMNAVIPWRELVQMIEPFFPNPKGPGRRPVSLEYMLRILFLQHWYKLTDPGVEEALYDVAVFRRFVGIDLGREPAPDETTVCKFRRRLEENNLGEMLFKKINAYLASKGLKAKRRCRLPGTEEENKRQGPACQGLYSCQSLFQSSPVF